MKITSSVFADNAYIPKRYTCDGENINPPLSFADVPSSAKSLALIVDDPDAPMGTWTHWIVYNISPSITEISEHTAPENAAEGITSFGKPGYGGPCPPSGIHRYLFKLYALDSMLSLKKNVKKEEVEKEIRQHVLESAQIIGLYKR